MSPRFYTLWILALTLTATAVFAFGWTNPFVLDATNKIVNNPDVRARTFRAQTFFDAYSADQAKGTHLRNDPSRPLTYFCYWALWQLGGGASWPFHVFATLLHLLSSFLLGRLVWKLWGDPRAGAASSFLFLVLPLNAGTVLYPFALSDVLATTFTLLVLNLSLQPTLREIILACGALILALGAKQSSVVVPVLAWAVNLKSRKMPLALFAVAAVYVILRLIWFGRIGDLEAEQLFPAGQYFLSQGVMIFKYLGLLLAPVGLSLDHAVSINDYSLAIKVAAWLALAAAVVFCRKNLPLLLFLIPLLPTSSIFPTTDLLVERRAYLPSAGLAMGLALLLSRWKYFVPVMSAAVIVYGALSIQRARALSTEEKVYQEVLKLYPRDARAMGNIAMLHLESHRYAEAKDELEATLKIDPQNVDVLSNLAALHQIPDSGFFSPPKAQAVYQTVLEIEPNHLNSLRNLGFLQLSLGRTAEAKIYFHKVLELNPRSSIALAGLGKAEIMEGHPAEAVILFEAALAEEPGQPFALEELKKISK